MKTKELKNEINQMLDGNIGIMLYAVLKTNEEKKVKFINIADEEGEEDNTSVSLLEGFTEIIRNKLDTYNEDDEVMRLSSADERKNALYYYDLDEIPPEMEKLKSIFHRTGVGETFCFREDKLGQIIALIVVIGNENENIILLVS